MTDDEIWALLAASPPARPRWRRCGPTAGPTWRYDVDDRCIVFNTSPETVKGRNLARTGWAALCVDDERPPFAVVLAEGPVELSDEADGLHRWATRIGGRYWGPSGRGVGGPQPERFSSAVDLANERGRPAPVDPGGPGPPALRCGPGPGPGR